MGQFEDTFKPVNVARNRGPLGDEEDLIGQSVPTSPLAPTPPSQPEVEEPSVEEPPSILSRLRPVEEEEEEETTSILSRLRPVEEEITEVPVEETTPMGSSSSRLANRRRMAEEKVVQDEQEAAYIHQMMPEGIEPGSYSPDDLSTNDDLYNAILPYMEDRVGVEQLRGKDKEEIVEMYLNRRRFAAMSGNIVSNVNEYDYINDIEDDPEKLENAGRAYVIYQNMAGITSDEYSWGEAGWAAFDVVRGILADPITYVSLGVGKAASGAAVKSGTHAVERQLTQTVMRQLAQGVRPAAVLRGSQATSRAVIANVAAQQADNLAAFTARASTSVGQRLQTRAFWAEVGATMAVDTVAGTGAELLYQDTLVNTGVQDAVDRNSVAMVAIGTFVMGLGAGGLAASRGFTGTALPSQIIQPGTGRETAESLSNSIKDYFSSITKEVEAGTSWANKVQSGSELSVQDTNFFIDLLQGVSTKNDAGEEVVQLPGLVQTMQENGFFFVRRDDDDKISNFIADFITENMSDEDVAGIVTSFERSSGTKLTGFVDEAGEAITGLPNAEQFANAFAAKINDVARSLNSVSQAARRLDLNLEDMDVDTFFDIAIGQRLMGRTRGDALGARVSNTVFKTISQNQNRYIRALVSHFSTSKLNLLGWGVSSGMGSAGDLLRATAHLGVGQAQQLMGMAARGSTNKQIGRALMSANANRIRLLLDPDTTSAAFASALERNSGALQRMNRTLTGGVDESLRTVEDIVSSTRLGRGVDNYIDAAQTATLVRAQDTFTKSQEYVFQMDKALRLAFNKSWDDFYNSKDAAMIMASKQYREMEESVVARVMQHTFSESYKGRSILGEVAGVIEDARNIPGIGMMVPFGRFFNNTVAFTARSTGVGNVAKLFGKFENLTHAELASQAIVSGGLIYSYASIAQEQRRQGLGMYQVIDEDTGEVVNREYDYPLSLFMAAGHAFSYGREGPPAEVIERLTTDFGISGLTRGLTTSADTLSESFKFLVAGELEKSGIKLGEAASNIVAQYTAGMTRPLQAIDTTIGVMAGVNMRPQNIKDGNKFIGTALSYVDNTFQAFTGQPFNVPRVGAVTGEADVDTGQQFGRRTVRLTSGERLMNLLDYDTWDWNADFRAMQMAAEAGNEYNRMFSEQIDSLASQILADQEFLLMPLEDQRNLVEKSMVTIREEARLRLSYEYDGEQSTFADQLRLTDRHTQNTLVEAMEELSIGPSLGDISEVEMRTLENYLDTKDTIESYERGGLRSWSR